MVLSNDFSDDEKSKDGRSQAAQSKIWSDHTGTEPLSSQMTGTSSDGSVETVHEDKPPDYSTLTSAGKGLTSVARVTSDGRLAVSLKFTQVLPDLPRDYAVPIDEFAVDHSLSEPGAEVGLRAGGKVPQMSIVVMLVGSRGDVQPHLALGQELNRQGHRVRIATHGEFRDLVSQFGLEFFDIGGDPAELTTYMARNPTLMPGFSSLRRGDVTRNRRNMKEVLDGCWKACTQIGGPGELPFTADAIIANPTSFAHIHCAEALGIPVHMTSTMPWSPTTAFPHPLVNISSNGEARLTNYLSYALAELMMWQGLGGIINNFRKKTLGLGRLNLRTGPGVLDKLKVPWTYSFAPEIVQKPEDWKNHIDVAGFYLPDSDHNYTPSPELLTFLADGPPPAYIGFGSIIVDDPTHLLITIFEATKLAGMRVLLSPNWTALPSSWTSIPDHVFILSSGVPHDYLFPYVSCVIHHGGAGTTAAGLRYGKPTVVVPFFGDQQFWGQMVFKAGAGPRPIDHKHLVGGGGTGRPSDGKGVLLLREAIEFCRSEEARYNAESLGEQIRRSNGVAAGAHSFHRHLPLMNMRCDLFPEHVAVWWSNKYYLRLSAYAVQILNEVNMLDIRDLELHRPKEYIHDPNFTDPVSGGVVEVFRSIVDFHAGLAQIFTSPVQGLINTTVALPRGAFYSIDSIQEGLHHTPRLWGSKTRHEKPIKDWKDGWAEGSKALFYGVMDGVSGLVTEPIDGWKSEGTVGALKGTGRSLLNVGVRPAAGALSFVTKPVKGHFFSLMSSFGDHASVKAQLRAARTVQGVEHSALASDSEKLQVITRWQKEVTKPKVKERRKIWEQRAWDAIHREGFILRATSPKTTGPPGGSYPVPAIGNQSQTARRRTEPASQSLPPSPSHWRTYSGTSSPVRRVGEWGVVDESPFFRGPEAPGRPQDPLPEYDLYPRGMSSSPREKDDSGVLAERLALEQAVAEAERRGYERGLEEAALKQKGKQRSPLQ